MREFVSTPIGGFIFMMGGALIIIPFWLLGHDIWHHVSFKECMKNFLNLWKIIGGLIYFFAMICILIFGIYKLTSDISDAIKNFAIPVKIEHVESDRY